MKLAKPAGGLSHIQPPPDGASKAGGGPFCESGHRAWYPGNDRSQAPGGCPCSSRNGGAGPRAWYPGEDVCSGPRRVPLQPHRKGSRTPLRHRLPVPPSAPRGRGSTVRRRTFPEEEEAHWSKVHSSFGYLIWRSEIIHSEAAHSGSEIFHSRSDPE